MALAEVARFGSLSEAEVARSALQASGFAAVLADPEPVAAMWREPYGEGGWRLCVPEDEASNARAVLRAVQAHAPAPAWEPPAASTAERFMSLRVIVVAVLFAALLAFALVGRL